GHTSSFRSAIVLDDDGSRLSFGQMIRGFLDVHVRNWKEPVNLAGKLCHLSLVMRNPRDIRWLGQDPRLALRVGRIAIERRVMAEQDGAGALRREKTQR